MSKDEGFVRVLEHTSESGAVNYKQHPILNFTDCLRGSRKPDS
jgi:hypothetical protein